MKHQKGVTLIDVLITVAILGVLTAIAYPSYQAHVLKSYRNKAMGDLAMIQLIIEENRTNGTAYTSYPSLISSSLCTACDNSGERYTYKMTERTTTSYTLTAEQEPLQNEDSCGNLTLKSTGETGPDGCWN